MTSISVLHAEAVPARPKGATVYPRPFASRVAGRLKRSLGDAFGLKNFGVNLTKLDPGAMSALMHRHSVQDEFVYVIEGELTLVTPDGEARLTAGMCAGFPARGIAHHLVNKSPAVATYLEIGDRLPGDSAEYPMDDLQAVMTESGWRLSRKSGEPY